MTTAKDLAKFINISLKGKTFVVAIQREAYMHVASPRGIVVKRGVGGAHSLLDGILKTTGGFMVAIAAGDADAAAVDARSCVQVPPKDPAYTLKRIFLKKKELEGFYYGFANQTLWPLCHAVFVKPLFQQSWWEEYVRVNRKFSDAILEELKGKEGCVWINDYHLALLPSMLKAANVKLRVGAFWHIPWPTYEIFRICPWRRDLMAGLLGADFIGFHRGYHVENFIECCKRDLEVLVDSEPQTITFKNHVTKVVNLPAGIDYTEIKERVESHRIQTNLLSKDFDIDTQYVAIGVDRVDYTKGIPERLRIIDRFLEKYPQFQGKFTYLSIGAPSRVHIPAYKQLNHEIVDLVEKINWKYGTSTWEPIHFVNESIPREKVFSYYHLSDVCLVTSLDDGMNLVAKEYVICNKPDRGMLLLSKFTGAAKDLTSALLINPYDTEGTADALNIALTMPPEEKKKRNNQMRHVLAENNIYQWGIKFLQETIA